MANPVSNLSPDELASYRDAFSTFDINNDGTISTSELSTVLHSLGRKPSDSELQQIIGKMDLNHNGVIEFDEFVRLMSSDILINAPKTSTTPGAGASSTGKAEDGSQQLPDELQEVFNTFDADGSGKISKSELGTLLKTLGEWLSQDDLQEMIRAADLNGDGEIDFAEFKKMVTDKTST